jgi:hypothetical protein
MIYVVNKRFFKIVLLFLHQTIITNEIKKQKFNSLFPEKFLLYIKVNLILKLQIKINGFC